jgi:hypothetical protein
MNYKIKTIQCKRCGESVSPGMNFCTKCALPVNLSDEYTREQDLENENKYLKDKYSYEINAVREEMNQKLGQIISMIQQNPMLAQVKPNVLLKHAEPNGVTA